MLVISLDFDEVIWMSCLMCQAYDELMKAFAERNKVSNLCVDSSLTKEQRK